MKANIKVTPNSKKQEIQKISECEYQVYLKSVPENNKSNEELVRLFKKYAGKNIKIIKGQTSRNKVIEYG